MLKKDINLQPRNHTNYLKKLSLKLNFLFSFWPQGRSCGRPRNHFDVPSKFQKLLYFVMKWFFQFHSGHWFLSQFPDISWLLQLSQLLKLSQLSQHWQHSLHFARNFRNICNFPSFATFRNISENITTFRNISQHFATFCNFRYFCNFRNIHLPCSIGLEKPEYKG